MFSRAVNFEQLSFCTWIRERPDDLMRFLSRLSSERLDSEPGRLLHLHQPAAADGGGGHPLQRAGGAGHLIRATPGNDCVIRPREHSAMQRQTRRHARKHQTASNSGAAVPSERTCSSLRADLQIPLSVSTDQTEFNLDYFQHLPWTFLFFKLD